MIISVVYVDICDLFQYNSIGIVINRITARNVVYADNHCQLFRAPKDFRIPMSGRTGGEYCMPAFGRK